MDAEVRIEKRKKCGREKGKRVKVKKRGLTLDEILKTAKKKRDKGAPTISLGTLARWLGKSKSRVFQVLNEAGFTIDDLNPPQTPA